MDITTARYDKGIVNYLDVTQAQADLANAKASLDETVRQRGMTENQLAILVGSLPTNFILPVSPMEGPPPVIPPGIPSTILLKRPDISQAEQAMASQHALVNAAYANFFPSLSLTGALGFLSPDLSHFLKWIRRYWLIGANMNQTIFDGGRNESNFQVAYARFLQASGTYQQQVLIAFQEVEDALKNIEQYQKQSELLAEVVEAASKATKLSRNRYINGTLIYLEVVENERLEMQAKINWIRSLSARYSATIQLIKALGGSW